MDEIIRRYCPGQGRHFFDASSKRFFASRMPHYGLEGPGGCFFVTSEQFVASDGTKAPRLYTVRQLIESRKIVDGAYATVAPANDVKTIVEFNRLTRGRAWSAARQLAEGKGEA